MSRIRKTAVIGQWIELYLPMEAILMLTVTRWVMMLMMRVEAEQMRLSNKKWPPVAVPVSHLARKLRPIINQLRSHLKYYRNLKACLAKNHLTKSVSKSLKKITLVVSQIDRILAWSAVLWRAETILSKSSLHPKWFLSSRIYLTSTESNFGSNHLQLSRHAKMVV